MILDNIQMKRESKSFTDALYAVLTAAGLFQGPKFLLSGLSGMAFKFTVHEQLLPLSVTAYGQWGEAHQPAIDNLGIFTSNDGGRTRHESFAVYQQTAVDSVKRSLDRGLACIYWIPEFGVIHGYDEEDRVFYVQDGWSRESHCVLYDNFGVNITGFWYCQFVGDHVVIPLRDTVLESLRLALDDWETPHRTLPDRSLASGRLAYSYLLRGLQQGDSDTGGAGYILDSYLSARTEIRMYLEEVQAELPGLSSIHSLYAELEAVMREALTAARPSFKEHSKGTVGQQVPLLCRSLELACALEEQAMQQARLISGRYPDLKRSILPRWGAHTAR
ncbi:hypothetical protein [Paenibacillus sp. MMS20-IR301]|uniref:hypothetical protein n=1 Tax=Paenibacillus sp. MMS20-IR301 TaxID=2895946 RepID=UPI0028EBABBB|nr:hypothetical protein [Paenibacillus sp. MMS20-IR301]WNS45729.1 hypothetical protein LOS79_10800 [Paenibacillus sp. MMS20-IR301]